VTISRRQLACILPLTAVGVLVCSMPVAADSGCYGQSIASGPLNQIASMYSPGSSLWSVLTAQVNAIAAKIGMSFTAIAFVLWLITRWLRGIEGGQWFFGMGWKLITLGFMMCFILGAFGSGQQKLAFPIPSWLQNWVPAVYSAAATTGFQVASGSANIDKCFLTSYGNGSYGNMINPGAIVDTGIAVSFAPIWPSFLSTAPAGSQSDPAWKQVWSQIISLTNKIAMMAGNALLVCVLVPWCAAMFFCYCMVAWSVLVALIEAFTAIYGVVLLAFMPWKVTAPIAEGMLKYITTVAIQFFVMFGVVGIGSALSTTFVAQEAAIASGASSILEYPGTMLAHLVVMLFWMMSSRHIPKMVTAMVSGVPGLNGPEGLGTALPTIAAGTAGAAVTGKILAGSIGKGAVSGAAAGSKAGIPGAIAGALIGAGKGLFTGTGSAAVAGARSSLFGPTALGKNRAGQGASGGGGGGKGPQGSNTISSPGAGKWDNFLDQLVNGPGKGNGPGGQRDESAFDRIQNRFDSARKSFDHDRNRGSVAPMVSHYDD